MKSILFWISLVNYCSLGFCQLNDKGEHFVTKELESSDNFFQILRINDSNIVTCNITRGSVKFIKFSSEGKIITSNKLLWNNNHINEKSDDFILKFEEINNTFLIALQLKTGRRQNGVLLLSVDAESLEVKKTKQINFDKTRSDEVADFFLVPDSYNIGEMGIVDFIQEKDSSTTITMKSYDENLELKKDFSKKIQLPIDKIAFSGIHNLIDDAYVFYYDNSLVLLNTLYFLQSNFTGIKSIELKEEKINNVETIFSDFNEITIIEFVEMRRPDKLVLMPKGTTTCSVKLERINIENNKVLSESDFEFPDPVFLISTREEIVRLQNQANQKSRVTTEETNSSVSLVETYRRARLRNLIVRDSSIMFVFDIYQVYGSPFGGSSAGNIHILSYNKDLKVERNDYFERFYLGDKGLENSEAQNIYFNSEGENSYSCLYFNTRNYSMKKGIGGFGQNSNSEEIMNFKTLFNLKVQLSKAHKYGNKVYIPWVSEKRNPKNRIQIIEL